MYMHTPPPLPVIPPPSPSLTVPLTFWPSFLLTELHPTHLGAAHPCYGASNQLKRQPSSPGTQTLLSAPVPQSLIKFLKFLLPL